MKKKTKNDTNEKKLSFGYMYRGNGYGFWDTIVEAQNDLSKGRLLS